MKKTIALLLASIGIAFGDSLTEGSNLILSKNAGEVQLGNYELTGLTSNHEYTLAITLNLDMRPSGKELIFSLAGSRGDNVFGGEGIAFDKGGIDYVTTSLSGNPITSLESALTPTVYNYNWQDTEKGFQSLKNVPNWNNATDAVFVLVGKSDFTMTGYLFIGYQDDNVISYNGMYNTKLTGLDISTLKISDECVESFRMYDTVMDTPGVKAIAQDMLYSSQSPAAPEPTTATLSLLALAGLAARRRRK